MAQKVKNLPTMWETLVPSLGQEDPLEMKMATSSSILVHSSSILVHSMDRGVWWATLHRVAKCGT